jgi:hypothetical protein
MEPPNRVQAEEILKERLRAAGVLAPATPPTSVDIDEDIEPAQVEGEMLSEMIIRERR